LRKRRETDKMGDPIRGFGESLIRFDTVTIAVSQGRPRTLPVRDFGAN